ncbi:hypothetical protein [Actinosynnema sp. NPDC023587]|uniref:hypothetical protein n=1 Tax=Actinosynnema sp. NPDC023587 TaxID=3154695 RepID=UPI0033FF519D
MAEKSSISDCLERIVDAVCGGELTAAKHYAGHLLSKLDQHTFGIVADCVDTIERYPDRAEVHLRARWKAAGTDTDRAVIATFGTAYLQRRPAYVPPPRHSARDTAPRDGRTEFRPEARRTLTPARRAELRRQDRRDALAADYGPRAGADDQPPRATVYAGGLDYDRAAVPALRGTPCVRCWLERAPSDYTAACDDGLCGECREKGRPGIPPLPEGHTRVDAIEARCAFITANYPIARALLARWWKSYATPADRTTITAWVHRNPFPATAPEPSAPPSAPVPHLDQRTADNPTPQRANNPTEQASHPVRCTQCGDHLDTADTDLCPECQDVERMVAAD